MINNNRSQIHPGTTGKPKEKGRNNNDFNNIQTNTDNDKKGFNYKTDTNKNNNKKKNNKNNNNNNTNTTGKKQKNKENSEENYDDNDDDDQASTTSSILSIHDTNDTDVTTIYIKKDNTSNNINNNHYTEKERKRHAEYRNVRKTSFLHRNTNDMMTIVNDYELNIDISHAGAFEKQKDVKYNKYIEKAIFYCKILGRFV